MNKDRIHNNHIDFVALENIRSLDLTRLRKLKPIRIFALGKSGQSYLLPNGIVCKSYSSTKQDRMESELWALSALEPYPYFPKIIKVDYVKNYIYMTYVGDRIYKIAPDDIPVDYLDQLDGIVDALLKADVFHRDIHLYHVTLYNGRLHLIDFEKSCTHKEARDQEASGNSKLWYSEITYIRDLVVRHFDAIKSGCMSKLPVI